MGELSCNPFTVREVGYEEHDKRSMNVRILLLKNSRGDWGLVLFFHDRKGGKPYRKVMNGTGKGKPCRGREV